jgi:hypothetical protein
MKRKAHSRPRAADAKPKGGSRWLEQIRAADPEMNPESAACSADEALKCLAVGDIDAALYHAMWAAWRVAHAAGQWGHWQMQSALMPLASREMNRRDGLAKTKANKATDFRRRLDNAAERLAALLNSNSRMSWSAMVTKAAKEAGISERAFRKHMPDHLKSRRKLRHD